MNMSIKKVALLLAAIITAHARVAECYPAKTNADFVDLFMAETEAQELCKRLRALNMIKDRLQKESQQVQSEIEAVTLNLNQAVEKYKCASDKVFNYDLAPLYPAQAVDNGEQTREPVVLLGAVE